MEFINIFALAFIPVFVAMDPVGILPLYISFTQNMDAAQKRRITIEALGTALAVTVAFMFIGKGFFRALGITVADFQIAGGLFWPILLWGVLTMIVLLSIYVVSFNLLSIIKIPRKGRLVLPLGGFLIVSFIFTLMTQNGSNFIMWFFDDMLGTGTTSGAGTPLMYLSPFHLLGEIYDWGIYGSDISILSFIWVPIAAVLMIVSYWSIRRWEYHQLYLIPDHTYIQY